MTIDEAIYCMKSYLPDGRTLCNGCKYYASKDKDGVFTCESSIAHELAIKALTAQSNSLARPSARWMSVGHKMARICSNCFSDEPYKFADHDANIYDFCPHCGAKMEGE